MLEYLAPKKSIYIFDCCAHAPHFEVPNEFAEKLNSTLNSK